MKKKAGSQRLMIGVIAGTFLVLIVGYLGLISPNRSQASSLSSQISDVRAQIDLMTAARHPSTVQAIRVADLFRLARAMPSTTDMPDILLQLSQVASQTGITFQSITPGVPVTVGSYTKIPIDLAFEGRFYDLSDFLYRLRNLVDVHHGTLSVGGRLFTVDGIAFGEGTAQFPRVSATLTVSAYVYNDQSIPGALTPAPGDTTSTVPGAPANASAAGAGGTG